MNGLETRPKVGRMKTRIKVESGEKTRIRTETGMKRTAAENRASIASIGKMIWSWTSDCRGLTGSRKKRQKSSSRVLMEKSWCLRSTAGVVKEVAEKKRTAR